AFRVLQNGGDALQNAGETQPDNNRGQNHHVFEHVHRRGAFTRSEQMRPADINTEIVGGVRHAKVGPDVELRAWAAEVSRADIERGRGRALAVVGKDFAKHAELVRELLRDVHAAEYVGLVVAAVADRRGAERVSEPSLRGERRRAGDFRAALDGAVAHVIGRG